MIFADMQFIFPFSASSTFIVVMIAYIFFSGYVLATTESHGKQEDDETSKQDENKKQDSTYSTDNKANSQIRIRGDQIIYCEGDLSSCHNVLTNIICSNVKYCIVGDITPFVMSNPV
jgi:Ca2+/Na+ antiporter